MNLQEIYTKVITEDPNVVVGIILDKTFYIYSKNILTNMNTNERKEISFSDFEKEYIASNNIKRIKIIFDDVNDLLDYYNSNKWKKIKPKKEIDNAEKRYLEFIQSQNFTHN